ncbi:MAG: serine/threonine protein kinase, partial [Gemmatimonadaceae bacterium]|nr:serine/threonine protein kinase [Gemmatimonadaceae bacterium]
MQFCPRDGTALPALPGLIAGKYEVVRELGSGGMGVVYLANQAAIERRCALKMLRPDAVADPDALARFHREARAASRISHPNVVGVFDFGQAEDGSAYLAMEYVDGVTLAEVLRAGPLPPRRAARIAWQVANGLAVAHELGIVHRDLKPGNIMLTTYRSWTDFVKVVDFGIAKPVGSAATSTVTSTGLRVGTPAYMSPEQWIDGDVDPRSDQFTLALIVVEMLSGRTPPPQPSLMMDGTTLIESVPKPAAWPEAVKQVLARALQRLPDDRYGAVSEFARELVAAVNAWEPPAP